MSTQVACRLDEDLEARFEKFRQDQVVTPDKSEVLRTALDEFLDEQGY
jgi:hypothetical protein